MPKTKKRSSWPWRIHVRLLLERLVKQIKQGRAIGAKGPLAREIKKLEREKANDVVDMRITHAIDLPWNHMCWSQVQFVKTRFNDPIQKLAEMNGCTYRQALHMWDRWAYTSEPVVERPYGMDLDELELEEAA